MYWPLPWNEQALVVVSQEGCRACRYGRSSSHSQKQSCSATLNQTQLTWRSRKTNAYFHMAPTVDGHFPSSADCVHARAPSWSPPWSLFTFPLSSSTAFQLHLVGHSTTGSMAVPGHMTSTIFADGTSPGPNSGRNYICKLLQESATERGIELILPLIGCWRWITLPVICAGIGKWMTFSVYLLHASHLILIVNVSMGIAILRGYWKFKEFVTCSRSPIWEVALDPGLSGAKSHSFSTAPVCLKSTVMLQITLIYWNL